MTRRKRAADPSYAIERAMLCDLQMGLERGSSEDVILLYDIPILYT